MLAIGVWSILVRFWRYGSFLESGERDLSSGDIGVRVQEIQIRIWKIDFLDRVWDLRLGFWVRVWDLRLMTFGRNNAGHHLQI